MLHLAVYDHDSIIRDAFLGEVCVQVATYLDEERHEEWLKLKRKDKDSSVSDKAGANASIHVIVQYLAYAHTDIAVKDKYKAVLDYALEDDFGTLIQFCERTSPRDDVARALVRVLDSHDRLEPFLFYLARKVCDDCALVYGCLSHETLGVITV